MRTTLFWIIGWAVIILCFYIADDWLGEVDTEALALEAFEEINQVRVESGLSKLSWDNELATLAVKHSQYMDDTGDFEHSDFPGENILWGVDYCSSGYDVIVEWLKSPFHHRNLMRDDIHSGAIGVAGNYATFMAR